MASKEEPEIPGLNIEELKLTGFKVHEISRSIDPPVFRGRRDFYKIGLVTGKMTVYNGDKTLDINGTVLFFVNPNIPHSVVRHSTKTTGYACLFTESFITTGERIGILKNSALFHNGDIPVIPLNSEETAFMTGIFQKMLSVYGSDYRYKGDVIRNCIELTVHEALKIRPSEDVSPFKNAAFRITHLFLDLLERQFPIERTGEPLRLRTAQVFATGLSMHTNYLNRSVRNITGKPTSVHIAERISAEAKALLQHTDWNVADIAYALGFDYR